jgi:predicted nucleic acid-binding protein
MASTPTSSPPRVFIDSSVRFAASLSGTGFARDLLVAAGQGRIALAVSKLVLQETERNLPAKAPQALPFFAQFEAAGLAETVDPPADLVREAARIVAVKDAPIVAGAVHAKAAYLASYDRKHLLAQAALIQARYGIVVATPDAVLQAI